VFADGLILLKDAGSTEFWPDAIAFAAFTTAISLVFVLPGYLAIAGLTVLVLNRTKFSYATRKRWLIGPPLVLLLGVLLSLANGARPSVAIRKIIPRGTPKNIRHFHYAHMVELMSSRHIAWFDVDPAELRVAIQENGLTATNGISLNPLLGGDRIIGKTDILDQIPGISNPVCYIKEWQELNFSTRTYLFTTPAHDKAVWYYAHDR
jgi:hypothetical protein